MIPNSTCLRFSTLAKATLLVALSSAILLKFSGCATTRQVAVSSNVEGTRVLVNSQPVSVIGPSGGVVTLPETPKVASYNVTFEADEYFPESISVNPKEVEGGKPHVIPTIQLAPKSISKRVRLNASPEGVEVLLNGNPIGTTDFTTVLTFRRDYKDQTFPPLRLTFRKPEYEDETISLTETQYPQRDIDLPVVQLHRLRHVKKYQFVPMAQNRETGKLDVIPVEIHHNDVLLGKTGAKGHEVEIDFRRDSKNVPWPKHSVMLALPEQFKPVKQEIVYESPQQFQVTMDPVTEFWLEQFVPRIEVPPTGAVYRLSTRRTLAMRDASESSESPATNLTPVTGYRRPEIGYTGRLQVINSFTPTPDGEYVIFGVTTRNPDGSANSNLMLKGVADVGSFVSQVTTSERYLYSDPRFGIDGKRTLVFAGNTESLSKPDIYKADLDKSYALTGGITRLTAGSTLYGSPSYKEGRDRVYYISFEADFAEARPRLGSVQFDGNLPTLLGVDGEDPRPAADGSLYFTRRDPVTQKLQLFRLNPGGRQETRLIQDPNFEGSNCFDSDIDPKGERLLFVSDRTAGADNTDWNIYMIDLREGVSKTPIQITYNRSMDYAPRWVPGTDSAYINRIFFLSNRGGAFNVWYLDLQPK